MSISRRSLALVLACGLALVYWVMSRPDGGPSTASADALGPFPAQREAREPSTPEPETAFQADDTSMDGGSESLNSLGGSLLVGADPAGSLPSSFRLLGGSDQTDVQKIVWLRQTPQWAADVDGDGQLNEGDLAAFQDLWDWADAGADFNKDGVVDPFDFADFVVAYDQRQQVPTAGATLDASEFLSRTRVGGTSGSGAVTVEFRVQLGQPAR